MRTIETMRLPTLALSLVAATACGKVTKLADGNPGDGGNADASNQPGIVKVTVLDPGQTGTPFAGVPVVFIDTDNTVTRVTSDTNGKAQATVHPGASVSAVEQVSSTSYNIFSVLAVKPGDDITLGFVNQNTTEVGTYSISFSSDPNGPNNGYTFYGPCGSDDGTANHVLHFQPDCVPSGTFSVYGIETNPSTGAVVASTDKNGLVYSNGGSAFLSGWVPPVNFQANYSDIPSFVTNVGLTRSSGYYSNGYQVSAPSMSPSGTTLVLSLVGPSATLDAFAQSIFGRNDTGAQQEVVQKIAGNAATYSLDVGQKTIPWLGALVIDPSTESITLPVDGTAPVDGFITEFSYNRTVNTTTTNYRWDLIAPKAGDITLPAIPIDAGDVMPKATDSLNNPIGILVESDQLNGYDDLRPHFFDRINYLFNGLGATNFELSISPNLFNGKGVSRAPSSPLTRYLRRIAR